MLVSLGREFVCFRGVLVSGLMIAFTVVFGSNPMGLCSVLMMFRCSIMSVSWHFILLYSWEFVRNIDVSA